MKILFLLLSLFLPILTHSANLVVVTEERPPLNYVNEQGELVGDATEMVKSVLAEAGIYFDIQLYPWARAYDIALNKPNTLIYSIRKIKQRESLFHWICPIIPSLKENFYRLTARNDIIIHSLEHAKLYTLGVVRDDFTHQKMNELGFKNKLHLDVNNDETANLKKLLKGRLDLIIQTERSISEQLKMLELPADTLTAEFPFLHESPTCMAFSLNTPIEIVNKVRKAHQKIIGN